MILLKLFWSFMLIGFGSFGGLSMIPQISNEVLSNGWMTAEQVTDIVAIAEMTPGPLGLNCASFAGMQAAVVPIIFGAAVNLVKGSLPYPPCVLLLLISAAGYLLTDINPIFMVILGALLGLVIGSYCERRSSHDPS